MTSTTTKRLLFALILLVYAVYAGVYIYKTSFVVSGQRFFVLFDDAMISMRYARNLADGYGLVWNPGAERVEGYTNPLWVVFMAVFHTFPIPASKMSLLIQISGGIFLMANLFFVKLIAAELSGNWLVGMLAVVLTAFYTPLNNWGLQGMEVSLLTLILSVVIWLSLRYLRTGNFSPWLYGLLGLSTLIRVDMAVPYLVVLGFLVIAVPGQRRQNLLWGLGVLALFIVSQSLFRLVYYGDLLPNTYYLKMSGSPILLRLASGFYALVQFIWSLNWVLFLFPLVVLVFRRDRSVLLPFLLIAGQLAYSVYVGGDAWEHRGGSNRYISMIMPAFFILFIYAADLARTAAESKFQLGEARIQAYTNLGLILFVLASMINFNFLENFRSLERWTLLRQPLFVEGNKEYVRISLALEKITQPQARIAVVSAGAIPYFTDRYAIDLLGKNDVRIAHLDARSTGGLLNSLANFRPGHMKWDYDYSIGELKPDVVVQLWGKTEEAQAYLDKYYVVGGAPGDLPFNLRQGSVNILWERVQLVQEGS
ncbi:MAG TPA: hypothetical protein VFZ76_03950 [Anaerolineales bacterium]